MEELHHVHVPVDRQAAGRMASHDAMGHPVRGHGQRVNVNVAATTAPAQAVPATK
jgi:hypothetical protein